MTAEKLKALLESGAITQEEFDELIKNVKEPEIDPEPKDLDTDPEPKDPKDDDGAVKKARQAEIDRLMAKERKEKAELKRKLERLEKKILTDDERKAEEFERQQQELEEQRRELMFEKNKMYAVKSMKKAEIGDSEEALLLMEKLVKACEDETEIDDMIDLLKAWKEKDVTAEVEKRFKANGYTPKKGGGIDNIVNPFKPETFNLTEQIRLKTNEPELAAKLMAAAGIKQ